MLRLAGSSLCAANSTPVANDRQQKQKKTRGRQEGDYEFGGSGVVNEDTNPRWTANALEYDMPTRPAELPPAHHASDTELIHICRARHSYLSIGVIRDAGQAN